MLLDHMIPEKNATTNDTAATRNLLEEFSVRTITVPLSAIELSADGTLQFGRESLPFTQNFMETAARLIGMPRSYSQAIGFNLFKQNFDVLKVVKDRGVQVCIVSERAVGLASSDYRPARTIDVLDAVDSINENFWNFQKSSFTDNSVQIDLLSQDFVIEPQVGDTIRVGMRIMNSETGDFGLKASLFTFRLICSNGAVMCDSLGTARWNYDTRVTYGASIAKFARNLAGLREGQKKLTTVYADAVERPILEEDLVRLWRRARAAGNLTPELTDAALGISAEERHQLQIQATERKAAGLPARPSNRALFTIHNNITHAAKSLPPLPRLHLERIGGDVLSFHSLN